MRIKLQSAIVLLLLALGYASAAHAQGQNFPSGSGTGLPSGCTGGSSLINCMGGFQLNGLSISPAFPTTPNGLPFLLTSTPSGGSAVASAWAWPGVTLNAQTGTTYTIALTDRSGLTTTSNGSAIAVSLPQAGTTNFANSFNTALFNINTGLATITPTTSTINGNATQIVPNGWGSYIYSDNTNYRSLTVPDISVFPSCAASPLGFTSATGVFGCLSTLNIGVTTANTLTYTGSSGIFASAGPLIASGNVLAGGAASSTSANALMNGSNGNVTIGNSSTYQMANGGNVISATPDTGLSRVSAGVVGVGTGGGGSVAGIIQAAGYKSGTNCAANGTAANPSVVSCSGAAAGMFSCSATASTGTCTVNTTAVTANSEISITQDAADGGASQLNVTCNTGNVLNTTKPLLAAKVAATSFTINLGTVTTNPACFEYTIVN